MKKILVTGSEGFVGQHLVNLLKKSYLVIGLSRNTTLPPQENLQYVIGDILDKDKVYEILKKHLPDAIIHLAGIAKTWGNDPQEVFNINLLGTLNIYETVLKLKYEKNLPAGRQGFDPKILFISSAEVYGKTTNPQAIDETAPLMPINSYGTSKLAADRLSYQYSQTDNLKIIILRPFPHIGPGQQKGFFVPDMASQIVELERNLQKDEILVGNLESVRDYLDVRDVVSAYKALVEDEITPGEVFNLCSGTGIKIADLLSKLTSLSRKPLKITQDRSRLRTVDLPVFVGNNQKIISQTGWSPKYTIDATLQDVIDYWRGKN